MPTPSLPPLPERLRQHAALHEAEYAIGAGDEQRLWAAELREAARQLEVADAARADLLAEVERLRVDAERWQAIRKCGSSVKLYLYDDPDDPLSGDWVYKAHPSQFDALAASAIDSAMKGESK